MVYIVMGVSGSGKTTIGKILAKTLGLAFYDADDFHSQCNLDKMKNALPLADEDRVPWLVGLAKRISEWNQDRGAVLACSALKDKYRRILSRNGSEQVVYIHLEGDKQRILERMRKRDGHFFPAGLLDSQFNALEVPVDTITVNIDKTPGEICADIRGILVGKGFISPTVFEKPDNE